MRSTTAKPAASAEQGRLQTLTATLKGNLEICAKEPTVDAVHDTRTGTRRIEAMLDSLLRERIEESQEAGSEAAAALQGSARRWLKLLKNIRRAAGAVRDLDVHRKLLEKQWLPKKNGRSDGGAEGSAGLTEAASGLGDAVDGAGAPAPLPKPVEEQAKDLDTWLKHVRQHHAQPLIKSAGKWSARLEGELASFEEAVSRVRRRRAMRSAAVVALEEFARLSHQMQQLNEGNLHDFRKGAKKARYMAESGGDDREAGLVGKALKKLQDEIGSWHDWLVLADEAHSALGADGAELTALIEAQRDQHYSQAMRTAELMRGRLLGELQALSIKPPRRVSRRAPPAPQKKTS